jgi:uncharacterized protein
MDGAEGTAAGQSAAAKGGVTIVIQTRVRPESADVFAAWQEEISAIVAGFPGFIKQTVMPPSPPVQVDWVILRQFASTATAVAWLNSEQRLKRVEDAAAMLVGRDDINIIGDGATGVLPSAVSTVISTRIKPGQERAYRAWEQRIAAAQSKAPGFQGYRFEPPIPGVQDNWLSILRFDTEANLQAWLDSPERHKLLRDLFSPRTPTLGLCGPVSTNGSRSRPPEHRHWRPGSRTCSFCCCCIQWCSCSTSSCIHRS